MADSYLPPLENVIITDWCYMTAFSLIDAIIDIYFIPLNTLSKLSGEEAFLNWYFVPFSVNFAGLPDIIEVFTDKTTHF